MSRIGQAPITIPSGVDVTIEGRVVTVKGPKGELTRTVPATISVQKVDHELLVSRPDDERDNRALHGLTRSLVNNMVIGVTDGFRKNLEIVGVGYRAEAQGGDAIRLALGFSHPVHVKAPAGDHVRGAGGRRRSSSTASTRRSSARSPPTSVPSASPSRTRARASATRASACSARPARQERSSMRRATSDEHSSPGA